MKIIIRCFINDLQLKKEWTHEDVPNVGDLLFYGGKMYKVYSRIFVEELDHIIIDINCSNHSEYDQYILYSAGFK